MRFEQLLEKTKRLADPAWRDKWLDYKGLKDIIGAEGAAVAPADSHPTSRDAVVATLSSDPIEVRFFTTLKHGVETITAFFEAEQTRCAKIVQAVQNDSMRLQHMISISEEEAAPALEKLINCYSSLLSLESFAVMNYAGCGKILKKHDKLRGYVTKAAYMAKVVDRLEWSSYPKLLVMINAVDAIYRDVLSRAGQMTRARIMGSSAQSRLTSLSKMKRATSSEKLKLIGRGGDAAEGAQPHAGSTGLDAMATAAAAAAAPSASSSTVDTLGDPRDAPAPASTAAGPGSSAGASARPRGHSVAGSVPSDSDDDAPDAAACGMPSSSSSSSVSARAGSGAAPDDRRRTELDIAAFIAGVSHTPTTEAAGRAPTSPAYGLQVPASPRPSPYALSVVAGSVARAGLPEAAVHIVVSACALVPAISPDIIATVLRQQPHIASQGAYALAQLSASMVHAAHVRTAGAGGLPPLDHSVAMLPFLHPG